MFNSLEELSLDDWFDNATSALRTNNRAPPPTTSTTTRPCSCDQLLPVDHGPRDLHHEPRDLHHHHCEQYTRRYNRPARGPSSIPHEGYRDPLYSPQCRDAQCRVPHHRDFDNRSLTHYDGDSQRFSHSDTLSHRSVHSDHGLSHRSVHPDHGLSHRSVHPGHGLSDRSSESDMLSLRSHHHHHLPAVSHPQYDGASQRRHGVPISLHHHPVPYATYCAHCDSILSRDGSCRGCDTMSLYHSPPSSPLPCHQLVYQSHYLTHGN